MLPQCTSSSPNHEWPPGPISKLLSSAGLSPERGKEGGISLCTGAMPPNYSRYPHRIHEAWSRRQPTFDDIMLWAAFCLGFFGFMRAGEFTCPSRQAFLPHMLTPADISVDSHSSPTIMAVHLRQSKTDQFGAGMTLYLGRTGDKLCPVAAVLAYLAMRPSSAGPLFICADGSTLSRPRLVRYLRQALPEAGIDAAPFSGHSFQIGAATTAA